MNGGKLGVGILVWFWAFRTIVSSMDMYTLSGFQNYCSDASRFTQGTTIPILMHSASALAQTPRANEWDFTQKPVPTAAEIWSLCDPGCTPECCKTDNCRHHVNTNGMLLKNIQSFLVLFGGVKVNGLPDLKPDCFYTRDATGCLNAATNEVYMIREDGKFFWVKIPDGTPKPPRVFGHRVALFVQSPRVWLYSFGGRSPDSPNGINSEVWRFEVPYAPANMIPNSGVWEKVNLAGTCNLARTGGSLVIVGNIFYYYGGQDANMVTSQSIFKVDPVSATCTEIAWTSAPKTFTETLWDGSTASYSKKPYTFPGRVGGLMKYEQNIFVVIDGNVIEQQEIRPINEIAFLTPEAGDSVSVQPVKFGDEQYRQPKKFSPYCVTTYSSNVPQMHFVGYISEGSSYLEIKQVLIDPTKLDENTYNEILTFGSRFESHRSVSPSEQYHLHTRGRQRSTLSIQSRFNPAEVLYVRIRSGSACNQVIFEQDRPGFLQTWVPWRQVYTDLSRHSPLQ